MHNAGAETRTQEVNSQRLAAKSVTSGKCLINACLMANAIMLPFHITCMQTLHLLEIKKLPGS